MPMPAGTEVYYADKPSVTARSQSYKEKELETALSGSVSRILGDDPGTADLQAILKSLVTTDFSDQSVKLIFNTLLLNCKVFILQPVDFIASRLREGLKCSADSIGGKSNPSVIGGKIS